MSPPTAALNGQAQTKAPDQQDIYRKAIEIYRKTNQYVQPKIIQVFVSNYSNIKSMQTVKSMHHISLNPQQTEQPSRATQGLKLL